MSTELVTSGRRGAERSALVVGSVALAALAAVLASQLAWMCDDAYIAFRYVANAHDGHGLVWNRAPFEPVEGYSCFAWVMLLWLVWEALGVEPPVAANVLSISFGALLVLVTAAAAARVRRRHGSPLPVWCVLLAVLCVAGNRTSLSWFTSGLETAMFNLAFVGWVFGAFRADAERSERRLFWWSCWAALAALTRPDGLLLVGATAAAAVVAAIRSERSWWATARAMLPLLTVAGHVAWRWMTYGEWLPNTSFAKITAAWPEAGLRYLACFVVEQGAWFWLIAFAVWAFATFIRGPATALRGVWQRTSACAAVGAVLFHVAYYCLRVGGDPFEYRVLSYLIPLGAVGVLAATAALPFGAGPSMVIAFAASLLGWGHWLYHQPSALPFYQPIASQVPVWAQPLARWHDRQQAWLTPQMLCRRPRVHDMQLESFASGLPSRRRFRSDWEDVPIYRGGVVGLPAWRMPDVAVLDARGRNDWVVSRSPKREAGSLVPSYAQLTAWFAGLELDAAARYARADMVSAVAAMRAGAEPSLTPEQRHKWALGLVDFLISQLAPDGATSLSPFELRSVDALTVNFRFMVNDRSLPQGYVEDFAPNVTIKGGRVVVTPRETPLTTERVRELEAKWRLRALTR